MKALGFIVGMAVVSKAYSTIFTVITTEGKAAKALAEEMTKS